MDGWVVKGGKGREEMGRRMGELGGLGAGRYLADADGVESLSTWKFARRLYYMALLAMTGGVVRFVENVRGEAFRLLSRMNIGCKKKVTLGISIAFRCFIYPLRRRYAPT